MNYQSILFDWGRTLYDNDRKQLFADATRVLRVLSSRYRLFLVSIVDGDPRERILTIRSCNVGHFFEGFQLGKKGDGKNEYRSKFPLLDRLVKDHKLKLNKLIVIGDRAGKDREIHWAATRGVKSIWIQKGKFANELPTKETGFPTHTVTELSDICQIL